MKTELEEIANLNGLALPTSMTASVQMLELSESQGAHRPVLSQWPDGTHDALNHPGLMGILRRVNALGFRLTVDTSLRPPREAASTCRASEPGAIMAALGQHLRSVGAYCNSGRRCIGLAKDSAWHEVVHELCHATIDARVRRTQSSYVVCEPRQLHLRQLQSRGYSVSAAEQLVCHAHELEALGGARSVRSSMRALLVWDNMNLDAYNDLAKVPVGERSAAQGAEMRRVTLQRALVTGPAPRLAALLVGTASAAAAFGWFARHCMRLWPSSGPHHPLGQAPTSSASDPG